MTETEVDPAKIAVWIVLAACNQQSRCKQEHGKIHQEETFDDLQTHDFVLHGRFSCGAGMGTGGRQRANELASADILHGGRGRQRVEAPSTGSVRLAYADRKLRWLALHATRPDQSVQREGPEDRLAGLDRCFTWTRRRPARRRRHAL